MSRLMGAPRGGCELLAALELASEELAGLELAGAELAALELAGIEVAVELGITDVGVELVTEADLELAATDTGVELATTTPFFLPDPPHAVITSERIISADSCFSIIISLLGKVT
jgi:hypothetical protein